MSATIFLTLGMGLCAGSGISSYLAAPHQCLLQTPLSKRVGCIIALLLAVSGVILLQYAVSVVTAVFMLALFLMLVWSLVPLCAALVLSR